MNRLLLLKLFLLLSWIPVLGQVKPSLNTASNFTVLAATAINSTGNTVIYDNVGIWPGSTLTGFPPGVIVGSRQINNATAQTAQADLTLAYNSTASQSFTSNLTGQNLGGKTLLPGVYRFNGNASLNGTLTLDANSNPNGVFIFQITGNLTSAALAKVSMRQGTRSPNIFWQVAGSVSLGAGTEFNGTIMANQDITLANQVILQGRLLSRSGAVNLDNNPLTIPPPRFNSDISILKTASPGPFAVGSQVTFRIVVKNLGPNNETNLLVKDILPTELTLVSWRTSNGIAYNPTSGYWSIDNLLNGASDTLTVTATVNSDAAANNYRISNTAQVNGDGVDPDPNNNTSTATICIAPATPGPISGPTILCIGSGGNTYTIAPITGVTGYTWSVPTGWMILSGAGTNSITLLPGPDTLSAIISVTAYHTCGQSSASIKKIYAIPPPPKTLPPINGNPFPCRNTTGNVYSIPPQMSVKNYIWTVPAGWTITSGQGSNSITATAGTNGGNISVIATNECGASDPQSMPVQPATVPPVAPGAINAPAFGNPCVNQTGVVYSVTGVTGASGYAWTVPAGWIITSGQGTTTITVTAGSAAGNITVAATNGCGNGPAVSLPVTPVTTAPPVPSAITGQTVPCVGQKTVVYSVTANPAITNFNWTVPAGWAILSGQGTNSIIASIGSAAGSVSVNSLNGCGSSTASTLVVSPATVAPPSPASISSSSSGSPCAGQTNLTYTVVPVSGASAFNWTVPAGWTITSGQGTPTITVTAGPNAGNIAVVATNGCGSSTASTLALTPTTIPPAAPGQIAGNIAPCTGTTSLVYTVPVVSGATNYIWSVPAGWIITSGQGTTTITVTAGTSNGNIMVTASNGCGPGDPSTLPVIAASSVPPVPGPITGSTNICVNQTNVTYSIANVTGASGYAWTVPTGWTIVSGQGTRTITVNVGTTPGTIEVAATNGCGTGTAQTMAITPVTDPPVVPGAISGNIVPCTGQSNLTYTISPVAGALSYNWSVPSGWVITAGQGTTAITVTTSTSPGSVSVSAVNNCGAGIASTLPVSPTTTAAPAPGPITGDLLPCTGHTSATYSIASVSSASSYAWTVPADWTITAGQGSTTIQVTVGTLAGNVSVIAANGCGTGVASNLAVTPGTTPPTAPANITGNSVPCSSGGTINYSVSPVPNSSAYTWSVPTGWTIVSGQGTNNIVVSPGSAPGKVIVFASNGCGNGPADSLNVMVSGTRPPAPGPINAPFNGSPCAGQTGLVYSIAQVTGASTYSWNVPAGWTITSGQGTRSITVTAGAAAGNISVAAANGCGSGVTSVLAASPTNTSPLSSGTISGDLAPCSGLASTTFTTTTVNGASGYNWTVPAGWVITSGQGTSTITVTPSDTAGVVTVAAQNGCGVGTPSIMQVNPITTAPVAAGPIAGNVNICSGESGLVYAIAPVTGAASYNWNLPAGWSITKGQGTESIEVKAGSAGGVISVTALNSCGLGDSSAMNVILRPAMTISGVIKDESSPCSGLRYTLTPVPGATSYNWTIPAGWQIISGEGTNAIVVKANTTTTGTISVTAQNAGCTTAPLTLTANAKLAEANLDIPNAFSPNNDGVNEVWEIGNLENYPENELTIINRWGTEVYRQKGYRNTWNGQNLSAGTYYYILQVKQCDNKEITRKGYVTIVH